MGVGCRGVKSLSWGTIDDRLRGVCWRDRREFRGELGQQIDRTN
ncbi:hypothetical protein [Oxynema sp. CENA135]|nr:hypothetical protein [Oxynema sp. CENA135]